MDYSKLITRTQYEEVARSLGHRNPRTMSFTELERIAGEFQEEQKALYQAAKGKAQPASWVLADTPGALTGLACALEVPEFETVPDHVQEMEPGTEWVTCPRCHGEKHVLALGGGCEYAEERLTRCLRCYGEGDVLDFVGVQPIEDVVEPVQLRRAA